jgi:hypothetical protein
MSCAAEDEVITKVQNLQTVLALCDGVLLHKQEDFWVRTVNFSVSAGQGSNRFESDSESVCKYIYNNMVRPFIAIVPRTDAL